ncbi:MAG: TIGR01777 family oxidoreductase [Planctomycetota bacterium]|nr:TIGR01777 family oxidoreductase [Planctomycetota bacterium]MDA1179876.1 TIGR01777 family oxidoreductase [Planctomycetota bacterium]
MKIAITGSTGLVGSALVPRLVASGHQVVSFQRGAGKQNRLPAIQVATWDPMRGTIDPQGFADCDAVVHLAGENIAAGRWTPEQKDRIRDSRVQGTGLIARTLASLDKKPSCFVCASAIGFYGDTGDRIVDESSPAGNGFLSDVCQAWESSASPARDAGIRVVFLRFGLILSRHGGALAKMMLPFKMGVGGVIGSGTQYWSWIALSDAVQAITHAISTNDLQGPVNVVAPEPVTNREFTRTLGQVLHRPTILPMPAFAARLAFGEMADHLMLGSSRVLPRVLQQTGFSYQSPDLASALA